jgi:hypothetical protein
MRGKLEISPHYLLSPPAHNNTSFVTLHFNSMINFTPRVAAVIIGFAVMNEVLAVNSPDVPVRDLSNAGHGTRMLKLRAPSVS